MSTEHRKTQSMLYNALQCIFSLSLLDYLHNIVVKFLAQNYASMFHKCFECIFCNKPVFGDGGVTVPDRGPAHIECYQVSLALVRKFDGLNISELSNERLEDLKNLVLAEQNYRKRDDTDDIELF